MPPTDTQTAQDRLNDVYAMLKRWGASRDSGTDDGPAARPAPERAQAHHRARTEPAAAESIVTVP